jgi:hypothetical protein
MNGGGRTSLDTPPAGGDGDTLQAPWPPVYNHQPHTGPQVQPSPIGGGARNTGNCPTANPGGGGKKPPPGPMVAAPGDDENPFKDGGPFKSFDAACGLPEGSLENRQYIDPATNDAMRRNGFKQKWIGQDWLTGDWYSAYYNETTNMWQGGKPSSHQ